MKINWRFRLPHLSPKSLFVSSLLLLFLAVLGLTTIATVQNASKKAFPPTQSQTQPTTLPSLDQPPGTPAPTQLPKKVRHLPESCYKDIKSEQCEGELEEIIDKECGGVFGTACQPYYREMIIMWTAQGCQRDPNSTVCKCLAEGKIDDPGCASAFYSLAAEQACQKDPNSPECRCLNQEDIGKCLGQEIGAKAFGQIFCEMAGQPIWGVNFQDLCQKFGGSTPKPSRPEDNPYFGFTCVENPDQEGCLDYCYEHPDELGCPLFLANHCAENFGDPICLDIICTYAAPNLCGLCGQFPTACERALQKYLGR